MCVRRIAPRTRERIGHETAPRPDGQYGGRMSRSKKKPRQPKPRRAPRADVAGKQLNIIQKLAIESERGCVLVGAAAIDESLLKLLQAYFLKAGAANNSEQMGVEIDFLLTKKPVPPLQSFGIRIILCYVLGLIDDDLLKQFSALADIRNDFAHLAEPVEITAEDVRKLAAHQDDSDPLAASVRQEAERTGLVEKVHAFWETLIPSSESDKFSEHRRSFMSIVCLLNLILWIRLVMVLSPAQTDAPPESDPLKK